MAVAKQATTIAAQANLPIRDLAVEMCARPWIVEPSKNSRIAFVAILSNNPCLKAFWPHVSSQSLVNGEARRRLNSLFDFPILSLKEGALKLHTL